MVGIKWNELWHLRKDVEKLIAKVDRDSERITGIEAQIRSVSQLLDDFFPHTEGREVTDGL